MILIVSFIILSIVIGAIVYGISKLVKLFNKLSDKRDEAYWAKSKEINNVQSTVQVLPNLKVFLDTSSKGLLAYDQHRYEPSDAIMAFLKIEKGLEDLNPELLKISKEERSVALKTLAHFNL